MAKNEVRIRRHCRQLLLLLALVVWPISAVPGQQAQQRPGSSTRKSLGYAFVSPNTRENLTLEEAQAALKSAEEKRLITEAREVACRLQQAFNIDRAVGSWSDGAEHSTIIRARTNELSLRYAGS